MNIIQIIQDNASDKSGITIPVLAAKAGISINSLKPLLKELHNQGKIIVRQGINSKLIFPTLNS